MNVRGKQGGGPGGEMGRDIAVCGDRERTGAGRAASHAGSVVVGRAVVARGATSHSSLVGHRVQGAGCRVAKRSIATVSKRTARDISAQWARGERVPTQKSPLPWDVRPAGHAVERAEKAAANAERFRSSSKRRSRKHVLAVVLAYPCSCRRCQARTARCRTLHGHGQHGQRGQAD